MSFINFNDLSSTSVPSWDSAAGPSTSTAPLPPSSSHDSGGWMAQEDTDETAFDPFSGPTQPIDTDLPDQTPIKRTIIRKVGLKRNKRPVSLDTKVKLERVLGLTVSSNASLHCDPGTGNLIYPSGCVLVLYNQRRNRQAHIINSTKKPITACRFSNDGKYIVTGECGHQPNVRVWDAVSGEQLAGLVGHRFDINCVAFSPNSKYVVSVGSQHDMLVYVWDWRNNHVVASNKIAVKVKAISFSQNGDYFVTVGNRHVKFWYLEYNQSTAKYESLPLMGRNAILGDQRNNYFCDVACGRDEFRESTYAITKSGLLCEFNSRRLLEKWVELKTEFAYCLTLSRDYICVGCSQAVIRCFRPNTLEFVCTLPRPHFLGLDIAKGSKMRSTDLLNGTLNKAPSSKPRYADTIAITYDEVNKIVTVVYSDRSIYMWTLNDIKRIGRSNSFFYHSGCIWDVEMYPTAKTRPLLPPGSFLTCSSDDTIRIWNTDLENVSSMDRGQNYIYRKNYFSSELLKIIYMDPELNYLCDQDIVQSGNAIKEEGNGGSCETKNGIRSIKCSSDGRHLASGDRCGNIRIFDLEYQKDLYKIEAHETEVLSLEYSNEETCGRALLVSAGRDRLIHIYDQHRQYSCIQNIDDHSSSITAVKFLSNRANSNNLQLISCGADRSLKFRIQPYPESDFAVEHHVVDKSTFYDMSIDEKKGQVITASQDRMIRVYDARTGKMTNNFKGSLGDDGALIKIAFDPSATFVATSCTDKSIYIFDYQTGECLATTSGHSEIVTGLKFSADGRNLISISGDGCIFVWRLPVEMTNAIATKLGLPLISDMCQQQQHTTINLMPTKQSLHLPLTALSEANFNSVSDSLPPKFSSPSGTLPSWAKKQMYDNPSPDSPSGDSKTLPRGRWAQRLKEEGGGNGNGPADLVMSQGLVKSYANTFESLAASRNNPSSSMIGASSPSLRELKINRVNVTSIGTPGKDLRAKSSMSSGVEDDDDDRNTTDSDTVYSHDSAHFKAARAGNGAARIMNPSSQNYLVNNNRNMRGMVGSLSMANINDLPYDEEEMAAAQNNSIITPIQRNADFNSKKLSSIYMSTENLERIDQRNRYLKNVFENIDKTNYEANASGGSSSSSEDSGINQLDHSLSSTTTSAMSLPSKQQQGGAAPSKYAKGSSTKIYVTLDGMSDDGSSATDLMTEPTSETNTIIGESSKFSMLDTIRETPSKEETSGFGSTGDQDNQSPDHSPDDSSSSAAVNNLLSSTATNNNNNNNNNNMQSQPSMSKKREELAKTINEAKKKLESLGFNQSNSLTNSKSVANLRCETVDEEKDEKNYNSLSFEAYRKSISLSDLSRSSSTLPRRLSVFRANTRSSTTANTMNNYQFAPLWDNRRPAAAATNTLSRSPSTNGLNKVEMMRSQSSLCRGGLWSGSVVNINAGTGGHNTPVVSHQPPLPPPVPAAKPVLVNNGHLVSAQQKEGQASPAGILSGRSSAPPTQFGRKSTATTSCASSSRRGDSTEDEEMESTINSDDEHSEEHRVLRNARPVTPPKPNILKQIRRSSNAANQQQQLQHQQQPTAANQLANGHYAQHHGTPTGGSAGHPLRQRRLWASDTMRSSKSEFNLANIGRDAPLRRHRANSGAGLWAAAPVTPSVVTNDRVDLSATNPSSIPLSLELCQHIINELNFLTGYASRIHERALYSNNSPIVGYLNETMGQVSRDIQAIVSRTPAQANDSINNNNNTPTATALPPSTQEMFQQFLTFLQFKESAANRATGNTNQTNLSNPSGGDGVGNNSRQFPSDNLSS